MRLTNEQVLTVLAAFTDYMAIDEITDTLDNDLTEIAQGFNFVSVKQSKMLVAAWFGFDDTIVSTYIVDIVNAYITNYYNKVATLEALGSSAQKLEKVDTRPLIAGEVEQEQLSTLLGKAFIFTSAQNNTLVHKPFYDTLLSIGNDIDAELYISTFVYNKNGFQNGTKDADNIHYSKYVTPHILDKKVKVGESSLVFCGDLNILPTAAYPLNSFERYTGTDDCIIPASKQHLKCIATPKDQAAKVLHSTGTVTMQNYIQKTAGQRASIDHTYGALIVLIDDSGEYFCYQVQTNSTGKVYYDNKLYYPDGTIEKLGLNQAQRAVNIRYGDIHAEKPDELVTQATIKLRDYFVPENQCVDDLLDFQTRNHHNINSGHFKAEMHYKGDDGVINDLKKAASFLQRIDHDLIKTYVIESNHDQALEKWLDSPKYDFRHDVLNAKTYLELNAHIYGTLAKGHKKPLILKYALTNYINKSYTNVVFKQVDDSVFLGGIENGFHGHLGANGARGSDQAFHKLSVPVNKAHTHSPGILGAVWTVGLTGSMEQGYNQGLSSWAHAHIVQYPDSSRCLYFLKKIGDEYHFKPKG